MSGGEWRRFRWVEHVLTRICYAVERGGARIIVNAPPQHGKSEALSFWFPSWYLDLNPRDRVILASYGDRFASKWGRRVRQHFEQNPEARTTVSDERAAANDWETTAGGGMLTVGVGSGVTGEGGNLILIDDPHKDWQEALSETYRKKTIDWFNSVLYTRRRPGASIIVVQTRWHEGDLTGYLLSDHQDTWEHICLPALAEEGDPLDRELGEALCPEQFGHDELLQAKRGMGSHMFAGLYQQRPAPLEGGVVKRQWFNRYGESGLPASFDETCQAWDLTFKAGGTSYVVGQVWGRKRSDFYLVDQTRDRLDFPGTVRAIERLSNRWPDVATKLVEEAANGHAVLSALRDTVPGLLGVRPDGSKESRLLAVSGLIEAGNVWIPDRSVAEWSEDFVDEVVTFPNGANDDQVDAMTMALSRLSTRSQSFDFALPSGGQRQSPWSFDNV